MRGATIVLVGLGFAAVASAQPIAEEKTRFGITANADLYPQTTPKLALESAIKLLENKRFDYFVAHVLEPALLESKILEQAQRLERTVELDLQAKMDQQKRNPGQVESRDKLPAEPVAFAAIVREEAVARSFKYVVRDLQTQLAEYPENIKAFRKFAAEGQFAESGATASVTHKDIPGKTLYFKNNGKRWSLEDRQSDDAKPTTEK